MAFALARLARAIARIPTRVGFACAAVAIAWAAAPTRAQSQVSHSVTPDGTQQTVQPAQSVTLSFTLSYNAPFGSQSFDLSSSCTGTAIASTCSVDPNPNFPLTVTAGQPATITVQFISGAAGTTGRVVVKASRVSGVTTVTDSGWIDITVATPPPVVNPKGQATSAVIGTSDVVTFRVKNTSGAQRTYTVTASCTGTNYTSSCTPSNSAPTIDAGDSAFIAVPYTTTTTIATGRIKLFAYPSGQSSLVDSGWVDLSTVHATAPVVAPDGFDAVLKSNAAATFFFRVRNPNTQFNTWNFTVSCTGAAITSTCTPNAPTAGASGGDSLDVSVQFNVGSPGTTGRVLVTMTLNNDTVVKDTAWINVTSSATAPPYPISVTPNLDSAVATASHRGSVPFYVANTSGLTQTLKIWRSCSGTAITGNCTQDSTVATTSIMSSGPSSTFIGFLFPTGFDAGAAGSTGIIRMVAAKASNMSVRDSGLFNVRIVTAPVVVTPHGGTIPMVAQRDTFTTLYVKNPNVAAGSFTIASGCSGAGITNPTGCTPSQSSVSWGTGPDSVAIRVNFHTGNPPDTATVWVVSYPPGSPSLRDSGWVKIAVQGANVAVSPHDSTVSRAPSISGLQETFTVRNLGTNATVYTFTPICTWGGSPASPCTAAPTSANIASGGQTNVLVTYNSGAAGTNGILKLAAVAPGGTPADTGKITVNAVSTYPTVALIEPIPGPTIARDQCLAIALSSGAASECGDLRLVHTLPAMRTMNTTRAPTLIYSSAHARPRPVFVMNLSVPSGALAADSVEVDVAIDVNTHVKGTWPGSEIPPGATKRIAIAVDMLAKSLTGTRLRAYTITVASFVAGVRQQSPTQVTGKLAIVDRSDSQFGGGWWLAGLEQLFTGQSDGSILWVGGDGSTRRFAETAVGSNIFVPAAGDLVDFPDTLKLSSGVYTRYASNGVRVKFDGSGRHTATVNARGDSTAFTWATSGLGANRLTQIKIPPTSANQIYTFAYTNPKAVGVPNERLSSVTAMPEPRPRVVTIGVQVADGQITTISDPDQLFVEFRYPPSSDHARISSRHDKRQTQVSFVYDSAGKVASSSIDMGAGQTAIVNQLRQVESIGLLVTGSAPHVADTTQGYVRLDGPRPAAIGDTTGFWLTRFGGVRKVRNALGDTTLLTRADPDYGALVTQMRAANGLVSKAGYTRRGNVSADTVVAPFGAGSGDAVTKYFYGNSSWPDGVTRIEYPKDPGQSITRFDSTGYDALGHIITREDGRAGSRTTFAYYGANTDGTNQQIRSITYPAVAGAPAAVDSFVHGTFLGNVTLAHQAGGAWTKFWNDNIGRARTVGHDIALNAGGAVPSSDPTMQRDSTVFDILGRDSLSFSLGPALNGTVNQQLKVENLFDPEGNLIRVNRSGTTGTTADAVDLITSRWGYDRAGRQVTDSTQRGIVGSGGYDVETRYYDLAGLTDSVRTRRGHVIKMSYDALGRLLTRDLPAVSYDSMRVGIPSLASQPNQPAYPRIRVPTGGPGYAIAADHQTFSYDAMGRMLTANNGDARVTRTYAVAGPITSEVLETRDVAPGTFSHSYRTEYAYQLDGARRALRLPSQLRASTSDSLRYTYDPVTGALEHVYDQLGNDFQQTYTLRNEPEYTHYNQAGYRRRRTYNADGTLRTDSLVNTGGTTGLRIPLTTIRATRFTYDARGKMTASYDSTGFRDTLIVQYSGLGHLTSSAFSQFGDLVGVAHRAVTEETQRYDAMGNRYLGLMVVFQQANGTVVNFDSTKRDASYALGTGRLLQNGDPTRVTQYAYDRAGNDSASLGKVARTTGSPVQDRVSYYAADQSLRAVDSRYLSDGTAPNVSSNSAFEQYRYDALGRRVWTRADRVCTNVAPAQAAMECNLGFLRRTIWDGARELGEIEVPGNETESSTTLENDATPPHLALVGGADPNPFYGKVVYVHGLETDRPLAITRLNYAANSPSTGMHDVAPTTVNLYWNARGQLPLATYANGNADCAPTDFCVRVDVPGAWFAYDRPKYLATAWSGSLTTDKEDASGLLFRRNRYYNPATGRFTQEDPIGLAGGSNLYGFAKGDPSNYADPFGLCPTCESLDPKRDAQYRPVPRTGSEAAIGIGVTLGAAAGGVALAAVGNAAAYLLAGGAAALPKNLAETFEEGKYVATKLASDIRVYRVFDGGNAGKFGRWFTTGAQSSSSGAQAALKLFDNNATQMVEAVIPRGTAVYYGAIAGSTNGAIQVYVPNAAQVARYGVETILRP